MNSRDDPARYKAGFCAGWQAATNYAANTLLTPVSATSDILVKTCVYVCMCACVCACCFRMDLIVDNMDSHLRRLEQWRDSPDADDPESPPTLQPTLV